MMGHARIRWVAIGVVSLSLVTGCASSSSTEATPATEDASVTDVLPAEEAPVEDLTQEAPASNLSVSQEQALAKAESYLSFSAFSRTGLIEQLEFEGFSTADAEYAVDAVGADWNEQAVLKAASYLDSSAFSQEGLVEQLEFEGFTPDQAALGAAAAFGGGGGSGASDASGGSVSQEQAVAKAESYLSFSAFSRTGLIEQLQFEGFSKADAQFAVDAVGADWNEQAALKAASYLQSSSFSRSGLIDQLLFEGFTQSQAEYGVSQTGL